MSGSILGKNFTIATWGESHGKALGVVIDGCPAGIPLSSQLIQTELDRRKPGSHAIYTQRQEEDKVEILSGVFNGMTTGTPISLIIYNKDRRSHDYDNIKDVYRPGHADFTYDEKYGFRDYRGGGRSSGRETVSRVAAGAIAKNILAEFGIEVLAYTYSIGDINIDRENFDTSIIYENSVRMPDKIAAANAEDLIKSIKAKGDSIGGIIECTVDGLPTGIGEPVFDKLEAVISQAVMSIGAARSIEFGMGTALSHMKGSQANDQYIIDNNGKIEKLTNHSGGIAGGISDGSPLSFKVAFKPTPSISLPQKTVTNDMKNTVLEIRGRHDPSIVPRAVPVVEAMTAIALVDLLFQRILSNIEFLKKALL
ncbi:MAG TPA: chorismate synthase [Clostridiales bacterium]|nr:chorismate synthase [Clostridiales bacterium]